MDRDEAIAAATAVERGELPSGSVVLRVTGPDSLLSTTPQEAPMTKTITVKAKRLRPDEGDFIIGLDNGYVYRVERTGYEENEVTITCHDAEGGEFTITCWKNMLITIERRAS